MIRMALIGCGGMASAHQARFERAAGRLKIEATVDIDRERAAAAATAVGARLATTDFREALDRVEAVLIALPHHLHHPVGLECLRAGKHVLMEKPLALSERECLDLIEESERQRVVLMVAYCMRYHPLAVRMKELIDEQAFGETFHVSIWTEQYTRYGGDGWHHRAATLGGGQFFSHGCHYVDMLLHFLGRPVEGTHVGTNFGTPWMEREGTSDAILKFENGAVGYHGGTWGAKGTRLGYAFHAQATNGMLEADLHRGRLIAHHDGIEETVLETEQGSKHLENEMMHFLDCVEQGRRPLTDGPTSLQGLRVIWRLYDAERAGRIADLRGLGLEEPWRWETGSGSLG